MKFKAILARTTTDMIKSKIKSPELVELVLDVYMTPEEFAKLMKLFDIEFTVEIT